MRKSTFNEDQSLRKQRKNGKNSLTLPLAAISRRRAEETSENEVGAADRTKKERREVRKRMALKLARI